MAFLSEELYSLLVPLRDERLLVPRSCVAEVIRYVQPKHSQRADSWLRGTVRWRDSEVPVLAFERLLGMPPPALGGRTRIVIFTPLGEDASCPPYGILSQGFPQMLRVNSEVLRHDDSYRQPPDAPVLCQVAMLSETALIPDLEAIERLLTEHAAA